MAPIADPATVAGLPESRLRSEHLTALPASAPPAPWTCRATAVIWVQRATAPAFDWCGTPTPLSMVGFVQYLDTPVGPYHEVLAGALLRDGFRPRLQVPFIAVDSLPSVLGGRANWALPKTMATFDGEIGHADVRAIGDDWSVTVSPASGRDAARDQSRGLRSTLALPLWSRFSSTGPLGGYTTTMRASGRPQLVQTEAQGETLTEWLGSGRHLAMVLTGQMKIAAPS